MNFILPLRPFGSEPVECSQPHCFLWRHMKTFSNERKLCVLRLAFPQMSQMTNVIIFKFLVTFIIMLVTTLVIKITAQLSFL